MSPSESDPQLEFLEKWLSGPPPGPRELGPVQMLWRWCRKRPLLAVSVFLSFLVVVGSLSLAIWGWGKTSQQFSELRDQFQRAQETLAVSQQLLEQQKQQVQRCVERLRQTETARDQAQRQYDQARREMQQLQTRYQAMETERTRLEQQLQSVWALHLARQSQDWVFVEPRRSLLAASEAARLFQQQGAGLDPVLVQTLQDALVQLGYGRLEGQPAPVFALAISRDARWLITGGEDLSVRLWNLGAEKPLLAGVLRGHTGTIRLAILTPDQRRLITAGQDGRVFLWDLSSEPASIKPRALGVQEGPILTGAVSSDGRWLITGGGSLFQKDYTARLWDLHADPPGSHSIALRGHERPIRAVTISPDLRWAITAGEDRTIRLYHLQARYPAAEQRILTGHEKPVTRLAVSSN
ncbi:MAG TPA: hypothetical protein PK777_09220, partial [Thermoguttaceae bacterium]|nr:hypothetical protein [Thermoguttaceae bacterium]